MSNIFDVNYPFNVIESICGIPFFPVNIAEKLRDNQDFLSEFEEIIDYLEPICKSCLIKYYKERKDISEIATEENVSYEAINNYISKAFRTLRHPVNKRGWIKYLKQASCLTDPNVNYSQSYVVEYGISRISNNAFSKCKNIEKLYIPWYVEDIPESNFIDRSQGPFRVMLQESGFTIYGEKGTAAENVAIRSGVRFKECTEIIDDNKFVKYLGSNCSVQISENVTSICYGAFSNTPYVNEIALPKSINYIDSRSFAKTSINRVIIPSSVKALGSEVFCDCIRLTEVVFENENTIIDNDCFKGCQDCLIIKSIPGGNVEAYAKQYNLKFEAIEE